MIYHKELYLEVENEINLAASLAEVDNAKGFVIFVHGSGSSRFSLRNKFVARVLNEAGISTLLFDLLTVAEDEDRENRFNIGLLTDRLIQITGRFLKDEDFEFLPFGFFGASTGAAAAIVAAAELNDNISAIVSRGGRVDMASGYLDKISAATLFIVGGLDYGVIDFNAEAYEKLSCKKDMEIIEGATHLFEEEGKLEEVAELSKNWFLENF